MLAVLGDGPLLVLLKHGQTPAAESPLCGT
jgi:hypothetical protein